MRIKKINYLTFNRQNAPDVLDVANGMGQALRRRPHDAVKQLILDAGIAQIEFPELYKEFIDKVNELKKAG